MYKKIAFGLLLVSVSCFAYSQGKADLIVDNIVVLNARPTIGPCEVIVVIKNIGAIKSPPSSILFQIDEDKTAFYQIPSIGKNRSFSIKKTINFEQAKKYLLYVQADSKNEVSESDENNNIETVKVKVRSKVLTDLVVGRIFIDPEKHYEQDDFIINPMLKNDGNIRVTNVQVQFFIRDLQLQKNKNIQHTGNCILKEMLPNKKYFGCPRSFFLTKSGEFQIEVIIDSDNRVTETDETNNKAYMNFKVLPQK